MYKANAFRERMRKTFLSEPAWRRISLTRKRRRHWKRQYCRPWKNLTDVPANPIVRLSASTSICENLS